MLKISTIISGLFPHSEKKREVSLSYYISILCANAMQSDYSCIKVFLRWWVVGGGKVIIWPLRQNYLGYTKYKNRYELFYKLRSPVKAIVAKFQTEILYYMIASIIFLFSWENSNINVQLRQIVYQVVLPLTHIIIYNWNYCY